MIVVIGHSRDFSDLQAALSAMGYAYDDLKQAMQRMVSGLDIDTLVEQLNCLTDTGLMTNTYRVGRQRPPRPDNKPLPLHFYAMVHEYGDRGHYSRNGGMVGAYQDRQRRARRERIRRMAER